MERDNFKVSNVSLREEEEQELDESNIYHPDVRSALSEEDELTLNEAAFMEGYENAELNLEEE
jgi:hypothetical protein